ncbi:MAG TPA: hypothetical protein VKX49_22580 [Bryobacteraceae bacterium]|nr:hypothetical protein [Bryobacteraceae bacterium]
MAQHVKILGILHIIYSGLVLLIGIVVLVVMGGIAGFIGVSGNADSQVATPILGLIGFGVFIFFVVLALPGIIGGFGLMQFKPWARILVIVLSAFELISVPFGTALGIYGFWVLLSRETEVLFQPRTPVYPVMPQP